MFSYIPKPSINGIFLIPPKLMIFTKVIWNPWNLAIRRLQLVMSSVRLCKHYLVRRFQISRSNRPVNACIESCEHILFPLNLYQWSCGYSSFSFSMYILLHFQLPFYFLWWKNSVALRKFCVLRWPFFFAISRFSKLIVPTKLQFFSFRIKRFLFLFFFCLHGKKWPSF